MINEENRNRILIPVGDPAGIGTEITLKALASIELPEKIIPVLIGCKKQINLTYKNLILKANSRIINPSKLEIKDIPFEENLVLGKPDSRTGNASFKYLTKATNLILKKQGRAIVTAPIAKYAWHEAGHIYSGQTERLAELDGIKNPSMLFTAISPMTNWRMNTLLATTHIPLKEVPEKLCPELIISKLNTLLKFCENFKANPKLAISGLNPHSGEEGQLGTEEIDWLIPTLKEWRKKNPSTIINGPVPPDTCWLSAAKAWNDQSYTDGPDGILALYHDQGLIAVKLIAFDSAVNTTLGLSFIRTSPDHGTAFDIAGKGIASPDSMLAAIQTAWKLSKAQN
tara:strand:+ start:2573 stop:3595 length:1023 start_codon:yes stop_codon:yes gene_type:complete